MNVITFFGRAYTGKAQLAQKAADVLGCKVLYDQDIIDEAAGLYKLKKSSIENSIFKDPPFADRYTRTKAKCIAAVKSVLADKIKQGPVVVSGFIGRLIPSELGLHILVTAPKDFRNRKIQHETANNTPIDTQKQLERSDESFLRWSLYLRLAESRRPMDCDGIVNVTTTGKTDLIELISNAGLNKKEEMSPQEFAMAADVSRLMAEKGHPVSVAARHDQVDLVVHKPVLMFSRYGKKLANIVQSVNGINKVNTRTGRLFYQTDILPGSNYFKTPTPAPIKKQYEQLYARVTERRPAFMNRATAEHRLVAGHA
ncbi:cytidylate kinase family protein [Desulfobacter postgatei]|jgi:cytidylate kinase|uniref:cytidylate kinase family protein n=1 Tax=Desulfobacter postgatei TaxID=2293 RepID=UPI002A37264A|nr:cytidylate kinase family protein [Desulfobacter postgatei]MDX9965170.1 cytidylate kinase family protein [Desulfobacter postgatei]